MDCSFEKVCSMLSTFKMSTQSAETGWAVALQFSNTNVGPYKIRRIVPPAVERLELRPSNTIYLPSLILWILCVFLPIQLLSKHYCSSPPTAEMPQKLHKKQVAYRTLQQHKPGYRGATFAMPRNV